MMTMRRVTKATELKRFKEELQSDRNRVFRLVTGGTGAVIARKIEKEESGARLEMR